MSNQPKSVSGDVWKDQQLVTTFLTGVRAALPNAADQLDVMLRVLAFTGRPIQRVLDLGSGSGVLASALLDRFPHAEILLADFSEPMLEAARPRFPSPPHHLRVVDFSTAAWIDQVHDLAPFDAVVSGFAIHHQPDVSKRRIYAEIFDLLAHGAPFINIEHVSSASPWIEHQFNELLVDRNVCVRSANERRPQPRAGRARLRLSPRQSRQHPRTGGNAVGVAAADRLRRCRLPVQDLRALSSSSDENRNNPGRNRTVQLDDRQRASALDTLRTAQGDISDEQRTRIRALLAERAGPGASSRAAGVAQTVEIWRDQRGVPHIRAASTADLFFAHGYVQAQDRLWQLDYLRRQGNGRLSEIFGESKLADDRIAHTLRIPKVAKAIYESSSPESHAALDAFSGGVNAFMSEALAPNGPLPIEFDLLDYRPEPWSPVDSLTIFRRWHWYLTGRLNVISTPEAVRAGIGDSDRYHAFFAPDGPLRYIVPEGSYDPEPRWPNLPQGPLSESFWGQTLGEGSNNWAVSSALSANGNALLASDPHVYYTVPADWYEVHLSAPGFECFGTTYPGQPGLLYGRGAGISWGITNNICLLRDLYVVEQSDEVTVAEPVEIPVKGQGPYLHVDRSVGDRPIVDHFIPDASLPHNLFPDRYAQPTSVALDWVGFRPSDETKSMLDFATASTVDDGREALRTWGCPTFNFVFADTNGDVAYQTSGFLPIRGREMRGYRSLHEPADQWTGFIPFDGLPSLVRPDRGWVVTANNPTAPPDFPYLLFGTWAPEDRAGRAEDLIQSTDRHTVENFEQYQNDVFSGRAQRGLSGLLDALADVDDAATRAAVARFNGWDFRLTTDSVPASLFYVFFWRWHQTVIAWRFPEHLIPLVRDAGWGLSSELLHRNVADWFADEDERAATIQAAFAEAIAWLAERRGSDPSGWAWGSIHQLGAAHPAATTPLQHEFLDIPAEACPGGAGTLANAFYSPPGTFETRMGASYRMVVDMGESGAFRSITWPGQSGHPGSPHYADQASDHVAGRFVDLISDWSVIESTATLRTTLDPE